MREQPNILQLNGLATNLGSHFAFSHQEHQASSFCAKDVTQKLFFVKTQIYQFAKHLFTSAFTLELLRERVNGILNSTVPTWFGSGLEVVWKWFGSGLEIAVFF